MTCDRLKIAVQKLGRLSGPSAELLRRCDISFENGTGRLRSQAENFPLEIFFLRDDDIPRYVEDGVADIGIVGENILTESGCALEVVKELGFGRCRLAIAVQKSSGYAALSELSGLRIATSYPRTLKRYLSGKGIEADIHTISGSVEIAPGIGLADAICDLVGSGSTLLTNGLVEIEMVSSSQAVLLRRGDLEPSLSEILQRLLFRISAVMSAAENRYILLNAPNEKIEEISLLIPGIKAPTVMPLARNGWSSLHSVIPVAELWDVVERLEGAGAEGILVVTIDQMIAGG